MIAILLVTAQNNSLSDLLSELKRHDGVEISNAKSGRDALDMISKKTFALAVVDEDIGDMKELEFVKKLISINPMINCAVVSPLSSEDFHEASEGLGILAQLPPHPGKPHADDLLRQLKTILCLQTTPAGHKGAVPR